LKTSITNQKNVKSLNQKNNPTNSSKILLKQIKETQVAKNKKTTKQKQRIIHQMKNKGFFK
jgi:predicted transcriptional regulator YheO